MHIQNDNSESATIVIDMLAEMICLYLSKNE
jgi:hypothetical protein